MAEIVKGEDEKFYCPNCQTELGPDDKVCKNCGTSFEEETESEVEAREEKVETPPESPAEDEEFLVKLLQWTKTVGEEVETADDVKEKEEALSIIKTVTGAKEEESEAEKADVKKVLDELVLKRKEIIDLVQSLINSKKGVEDPAVVEEIESLQKCMEGLETVSSLINTLVLHSDELVIRPAEAPTSEKAPIEVEKPEETPKPSKKMGTRGISKEEWLKAQKDLQKELFAIKGGGEGEEEEPEEEEPSMDELVSLRDEMEDTGDTIARLKAENNELRATISEYEERIKAFEGSETGEVVELEDKCTDLESKLEEARSEIEKIRGEYQDQVDTLKMKLISGAGEGQDDELIKVLRILDDLLEDLPEAVIDKFAVSEDFKLYEKVFDRYGV